MKRFFTLIISTLVVFTVGSAQNVGIGTSNPKPTALLDITATNKGVLLPRLTSAQRNAIVNPERGLMVFDTDKGTFMFFDGISWKGLAYTDENFANLVNRNDPNPSPEARFGQTADISGNYAIIGAPFYASPGFGNKVGEAFIYFKDANGWKMQARLVAPDSATFDFFGSSVAIYGDYAVVAASQKAVGANYGQGKVYVFKRNGSNWNFEVGLTDPNGASGDNLGYCVDISITTSGLPVIVAGASGFNNGKGQVITYSRSLVTNTWAQLQKLAPSDLAAFDEFGLCVSMHKDYLAVGAPQQANIPYGTTNSGAVYIYVYGGGVFTQQQKVPGYYTNAQFGYSLSLFENKLAVGAPWAIGNGYSTGSADVRVLKRNGSSWDYSYANFMLTEADGGSFNQRYGLRLSLNNNQLLIGAPSGIIFPAGSSIGAALPGAAYLYITGDDGDNYYLKQKFTSPLPQTGDLFAHSLAIEETGNYILGVPYQQIVTTNGIIGNAGAVYFGNYTP